MTDQENIDHLERLIELTIVFWKRDCYVKPFPTICKEILKESDLISTTIIRRDYDGCSQADYLVQKMIAEIILDKEPHF